MGRLTVSVSEELYRALKRQASVENRTIGAVLESAVRASKLFPIPMAAPLTPLDRDPRACEPTSNQRSEPVRYSGAYE